MLARVLEELAKPDSFLEEIIKKSERSTDSISFADPHTWWTIVIEILCFCVLYFLLRRGSAGRVEPVVTKKSAWEEANEFDPVWLPALRVISKLFVIFVICAFSIDPNFVQAILRYFLN